MKKILAIVLTVVALTCFSSCSDKENVVLEHCYYGVDYSGVSGDKVYVAAFQLEMTTTLSQFSGSIDVEEKIMSAFDEVCTKYDSGNLGGIAKLCRSNTLKDGQLINPEVIKTYNFTQD